MCGIAGCVVAPGREPPRHALEAMAVALTHRGPDDHGILTTGNVGLVNRRLAIVDLSSSGHQPMVDASGRWLLTYNGEIFNHAAIRAELGVNGWRGRSDTETLLRALAVWGEGALTRCNGFFAFAAFDSARRRLLLARDRFGVKPLYLARWDGGLWFASEMRALLAAGVPARARRDVLMDVAAPVWPAGRQTPLEAIERMPPGGLVSFDTETLHAVEHQWYRLADAVDPALARELEGLSRAELTDRLESELRGSVRRRLLGDVPVGTACSGGLDSSLVTAFARDEEPGVVAFNASLVDEGRVDEGRWGEIAARGLGVELETVRITAADWRSALVGAVAHHEYPLSAEGSSVPISLLAKRARQRGLKVLLTGEAADELFGSYPLAYGREFRHFSTPLPVLRRMVEAGRQPRGLAALGRIAIDRLRDRRGANLSNDDLSDEAEAWRELVRGTSQRAYTHHPGPRGRLEAVLLMGLWLGSFSYLLRRMDKDLMAHSVETRMPFLDLQVVNFAVNTPLEQRVGPAVKGILRDVAGRHLPRQIVRRAKQPGMVFRAGRRIAEAARADFLEQGYMRDLLELPVERWRRLARETKDYGRLWTAEIWCRLFIAGQDVATVERDLWVPERIEAGTRRARRSATSRFFPPQHRG